MHRRLSSRVEVWYFQSSMETVIEQLELTKKQIERELYQAKATANRALEAQERADLERKVSDQACDEFRASLVKTKEAHDLAMQTINDI